MTVAAAERFVFEPLTVEAEVGTIPRLHVAVVFVLLQVPPVEAVICAFVLELTFAVKITPLTGSPVL